MASGLRGVLCAFLCVILVLQVFPMSPVGSMEEPSPSENAAGRWGIDIEQPPKPDRFIEDGEKIKVGKFELEVIYTPGHSPGGISFLHDNMVFAGDTLFQNSIGRTDFRKGSFEYLSNSIKKRLYTLPDETIVYTGHGPVTTIGDEKKYNAFVRT